MGIRIHTVLGYGWKDFKFSKPSEDFYSKDFLPQMVMEAKKENSDDSRAFLCRIENRGWYEKSSKITSLDFYEFIKCSAFAWESEEDTSPNPLILTSPFNKDWYRYDDIIDYYQSENQSDTVKELKLESGIPKPIYLYDGFVNKKTGERVKCSYWEIQCGEEHFEQKTGLKFADLAAIVPYEIALFCKVAKFPTDNPLDIYTASPMIYTHWC